MCFTYTFRDNAGARREATLEAASREAAFAVLKADGILPLSIREGGKVSPRPPTVSRRRDGSKKDNTRKPFAVLFCLLVAIAAIAAIALWYATRDDDADISAIPSTPRKTTTVTNAPSLPAIPAAISAVPANAKPTPGKHDHRSDILPPPAVVHADKISISNYIATHYTTNSAVRPIDPNDPDLPLITGVNQELGSLMSSELGDPVPPFPYSFQVESPNDQNDEFLKSLKHNVVLRESDSATRVEGKQKLLQARLDLLDAMEQGISVKDAIKEAYIQRVRAYEARQAYISDLKNYAAENPETKDFNDTLDAVNAKLQEKGIKPITREHLGLEDDE